MGGKASLVKKTRGNVESILDLTFLPSDILTTCLDLRAYLTFRRTELSQSLRSFRQQIRRGHHVALTGPQGIEEEVPLSLKWERDFLSIYGIDELTPEASRQIFWTWVFIPLVNYLQRHLHEGNHRKKVRKTDPANPKPIIHNDAFRKASSIIAFRHPSVWQESEQNWKRIRSRYFTLAKTKPEILPTPSK